MLYGLIKKIPLVPVSQLIIGLCAVYLANLFASDFFRIFEHSSEPHMISGFFIISIILVLSFWVFYVAHGVSTPAFVMAIFFGIAARGLPGPITANVHLLSQLVALSALYILFSGGLETPWHNFKKLLARILSLSFLGFFLTAFLFSLSIYGLGLLLHTAIPVSVAILLGAVLASTDPAAIIPVLKNIRFKNRDVKDIIVSESAVTDVTGTLLTIIFLSLIAGGAQFLGVIDGYGALFTNTAAIVFLKQIIFGIALGVAGYLVLKAFSYWKGRHAEEFEVDVAFFLFVPIIIFTIALILGGSGYLAAFIAGLLFILNEHLHLTEKFFNHTVEAFLKPLIFILLGAMVDPKVLLMYAPIGILGALVFMFIIRPISVFLTLGPFSFFGKERLGWRDLLFISFVRETGAIPAVLLVTVVSAGLSNMEALVPIGMWVILLTLIVQPPLTPYIAKVLNVALPEK